MVASDCRSILELVGRETVQVEQINFSYWQGDCDWGDSCGVDRCYLLGSDSDNCRGPRVAVAAVVYSGEAFYLSRGLSFDVCCCLRGYCWADLLGSLQVSGVVGYCSD